MTKVATPVACNCQALRQAARRASAMYDAVMAPHGLRISQFDVLRRLLRTGPISVQALAAEMLLDRTTMGRNLGPLERDGLIASTPDASDRRVRRLAITQAGIVRAQAAAPAWQAAQAAFEARFGSERSAALRDELRALIGQIDAP